MERSGLKVLVLGCGSIGKRHIRNFSSLGVRRFVLCDPDEKALEEASHGLENPVLVKDFKDALKTSPDAALICTPSSMHLGMATELAKNGAHLFIEKPLSHTLEGLEALIALVKRKGIAAMTAMCYRFHPVFSRVKALLDAGTIGRVYHVNYYGGQYLPDWHPHADYRKEYAANKSMGGGVVLTTIHGLDDVRRLFGEVAEINAVTDKVSGLEMDVEDLVMAVFKMKTGAYVFYQTDFLQRAKTHMMVITGSEGTIRCDIAFGVIETYLAHTPGWEREDIPFDINSMYVDEARHFLECIENGANPSVDIAEGYKTQRLAMEVKAAAKASETCPRMSLSGSAKTCQTA
ncbi:MAG: Gfo/Idh/MocA family oxidoreductase [Deltaproteobacteria bacterium]|nr:Gfo/Idh/MocA family oxidoreductase [Deltaproteobacteria bacterium]